MIDATTYDANRGPLLLVGMVWERQATGEWWRYILRRYVDGANYWSRVIHVAEDEQFCLHCLSTRLIETHAYGYYCRECDQWYGLTEEPEYER